MDSFSNFNFHSKFDVLFFISSATTRQFSKFETYDRSSCSFDAPDTLFRSGNVRAVNYCQYVYVYLSTRDIDSEIMV